MPVLEMKELLDLEMAIMVRWPLSTLLPAVASGAGGQAAEDVHAASSWTACQPRVAYAEERGQPMGAALLTAGARCPRRRAPACRGQTRADGTCAGKMRRLWRSCLP